VFGWLILLFTVVPVAELILLIRIGGRIGAMQTIWLVLATGIIGAWLARSQGLRTLQKIQQELARGQMPGDSLIDGAMILVAGAVLITPGIMTDCLGFLLLFPPARAALKQRLTKRFQDRVNVVRYEDEPPRMRRRVDAKVTTPDEEDRTDES
jgi:UPF0716 protein FxsA